MKRTNMVIILLVLIAAGVGYLVLTVAAGQMRAREQRQVQLEEAKKNLEVAKEREFNQTMVWDLESKISEKKQKVEKLQNYIAQYPPGLMEKQQKEVQSLLTDILTDEQSLAIAKQRVPEADRSIPRPSTVAQFPPGSNPPHPTPLPVQQASSPSAGAWARR